MKYCGECGFSEKEVDFVEKWRDQYKCIACLNDDPDYWQAKYHMMSKTAEYYIEQLEKTNCSLDNLSKALDTYEAVFAGEYPDEYVSAFEIKEQARQNLKNNALDKLTRLSEGYGLYQLEHPSFYVKK